MLTHTFRNCSMTQWSAKSLVPRLTSKALFAIPAIRKNRQFLDKAERVLYLFSCAPIENALVRYRIGQPVAPRRDRSHAARSEARRKKAEREMRIVGFLNGGVSIAEIAMREGVNERACENMSAGSRPPRAGAARGVHGAEGEPPPRGADRGLQRDVGRQPSGGRPRREARARARPLSRLSRRRTRAPPRAAHPGPSRPRGAERPVGTLWRRKSLIHGISPKWCGDLAIGRKSKASEDRAVDRAFRFGDRLGPPDMEPEAVEAHSVEPALAAAA